MKSVLSQIISCSDIYPIPGKLFWGIQSSLSFIRRLVASFSSFLLQFSPYRLFPFPLYLSSLNCMSLFSNSMFFPCLFMLCSLFMKIAWLLPWPENFFLLLIQSSPTFSSFIQVSSYLKGSFNSLHAPHWTVSSFVESHEFHIVDQSALVE